MVEIYYNAQSDNGTLTSSRFRWGESRCSFTRLTLPSRPCLASMVPDIYAEHIWVQGPKSASAAAELDDASRLRRSRIAAVDIAPERVVQRYGTRNLTLGRPRPKIVSDGVLDPRDNAIGAANRANVHRLLSSLAVFPFTQILGWV
jgi:hypothetical protein